MRVPRHAVAVRRLNRAEYGNVVRDLLDLEVDVKELLPPDTPGYGFDNISDLLSISPSLLERYMSAATAVARLALGDPSMKPSRRVYAVPKALAQTDRVSDDLPLGSRGGIAVRHYFPLDGEYILKVKLRRNAGGRIRGLAETNQLDIRVDSARIASPSIGGNASDPEHQGAAEYLRTADDDLVFHFSAKAGAHLVGVSFVGKGSAALEGLLAENPPITTFSYQQSLAGPAAVDSVIIEGAFNVTGPGDTPSRRRVLSCRPSPVRREQACVGAILSTLARRAYRRPVTAEDTAPLLRAYDAGRQTGTFEHGIQVALESLLVDPEFLFRIEREVPTTASTSAPRLDDLSLASRLSFFLWGSIPDEELLRVAASAKLSDAVVLEREVRRMMADRRADTFVRNFVGQWLQIRNLQAVAPDPNAFPDFDDNLRDAMAQETYLFVDNEFRDDRSVCNLLTANYSFLNERLARHYSIPNVYGNHFRRVTFANGIRGGLLGQGAILTVTSQPNRTSPVLRGKFLLGNILGDPPPPPPPNVPDLPASSPHGQPQSVRERLEIHRANPACASCHARMDPLGFALENFDGIGEWRNDEAGRPIDASGVLPDGAAFSGPEALRQVLAGRRVQFVTSIVEKLLIYALGRGIAYYDRPAIRKIVRRSEQDDYRWSSLILGVVRSTSFQR
jgi:hypothetical protein